MNRCSRRGAALVVTAVLLQTGAGPARGQLSADDIARLRAQGQREGWTFTICENEATRRPVHELCGARVPPNWRDRAHFDDAAPSLPLPSAFDWRTVPGFPAVRNQGGCGSCWAFAATAAVECAILITHGQSLDLAEQYLVSCTRAGTCGGGWSQEGYEYFRCNGRKDPCGGNGVVLESDFPYTGSDATCRCPYTHPWCIDFWRALGPKYGVVTVEQIKQAMLLHGPISASVATSPAFMAYGGGVFNAHTSLYVDHDVLLVGWDDAKGKQGAWILRNSWGPGWGDRGYMWIEYGCSSVGYGACYVDISQPDCNHNGIRDAQDVAGGTSLDCNRNGVPDECDLLTATSPDCNKNGIPDECDVALPLPVVVKDVPAVNGWLEISATGCALHLGDDAMTDVPLPFRNALMPTGPVVVGNDGVMSFGGPHWLPASIRPLPHGALFAGEPSLAPYWDDLGARTGDVFWQTVGTPPERTFVVEWYQRPGSPGDWVIDGDEVTFQVQVFETPVPGRLLEAPGGPFGGVVCESSAVLAQFLYLDTDFLDFYRNNGGWASIGFQMDGANGRQWSYYRSGAVRAGTVLSIVAATPPGSPDRNGDRIPDECQGRVGDLNCDGLIDEQDIPPFVLALSGPEAYAGQYAGCNWLNADCSGDGWVNFADIGPFVKLLAQ